MQELNTEKECYVPPDVVLTGFLDHHSSADVKSDSALGARDEFDVPNPKRPYLR